VLLCGDVNTASVGGPQGVARNTYGDRTVHRSVDELGIVIEERGQ
jgi:hypothetical protein